MLTIEQRAINIGGDAVVSPSFYRFGCNLFWSAHTPWINYGHPLSIPTSVSTFPTIKEGQIAPALITAGGVIDGINLGGAEAILKNVDANTIAICSRFTDTSLRNAMGFGYNLTATLSCWFTFSDSNIYFDYGNGTTGSGRLTASITKDTLPHTWVFVAGKNKGREIWKDGILIANNTSANASRGTSIDDFCFGCINGTAGDAAEWYCIAIAGREWSDAEIAEWSENPWMFLSGHEPVLFYGTPSGQMIRRRYFVI